MQVIDLHTVFLRRWKVRVQSSMQTTVLVVLSFESNYMYERGLSAAGEKLHSGACKFSPAAESPRSYCRLNRTMNADFPPPEKNSIQVHAVFPRRRKVSVHSSIQTTVVRFKRQYCRLNRTMNADFPGPQKNSYAGVCAGDSVCMQKLRRTTGPSKVRLNRQYSSTVV